MDDSIEIYLSSADEDEPLRKELENHLSTLGQSGTVRTWHRRNISAGVELANEINAHLNKAQIILLLISPDFMASKYCQDMEVKRAMERHKAKQARVIPILLRPVYWKGASFSGLGPLPTNSKAVTSWSHRDEAFFNVVEGVQKAIEELIAESTVSSLTAKQAQDIVAKPGSLEEKILTNTTFSSGHALLIGVGADLPITVKDATALYDVLVDAARAAYPKEQVELLTEVDANRQSILDAFNRLIEQVKKNPGATVIVYFSGHGVQIERQGSPPEYFLVPYGYDPKQRADTAISDLEFTSKIEEIDARKLVVLLDCCHAGGVPALKEPGEISVKSVPLPPDLLNILETGSGRVVVASSLENEKSYTSVPYSVFTTCLMEALAGKAAVKKDGFARILDVLIYLLDQVPQRAFGPQHPFVNKVLNLDDNFPLCYYAGGSKDVPGEVAAPEPPQVPAGLTPGKRRRLEQRRNELQKEWGLRSEKVQRIREALAIETDPTSIFRYEKQILQENATLTQLSDELDEIEQALQ